MKRRHVTGMALAGAALAPLVLCVLGRWESRFGGHGAVADALNHPVPALGLTGVLLLIGVIVRGRADMLGLFTGLVAGGGGCMLLAAAALSSLGLGDFGGVTETRESSPDRPDHVLVVIHDSSTGETETQSWKVRLETGAGPLARRWTLVSMPARYPGDGELSSARWLGPGRFEVRTDLGAKVYEVDGSTGRPTVVSTTGNVGSLS
ncbi:hypothetical protein ACIBCA_09365 [Kitasatospora sp. NPDC051170]|uniref:hypothetical protein n=1 Tax=Kitasatospora sp. NPDC051170 TaxID=3364056 RepID=UPI00378D5F25